jgi:hypothetical protein
LSFNLIKLENETNAAFYINTSHLVTKIIFDDAGQILSKVDDLLGEAQLSQIEVLKSGDKYIIWVDFEAENPHYLFKNGKIAIPGDNKNPRSLLLSVNENFQRCNIYRFLLMS